MQVYAAEISATRSAAPTRRVMEREKPAHTTYCVQVIEAEIPVGTQARLGVDAIVPPAAAEAVLDPGIELGVDSVLPEDPARTYLAASPPG